MAIPTEKKEQAVYHMILSELHRLQGLMLNMQTVESPDTEQALREHFAREQNLALARLSEWRQRRPDVFREANEDFQNQIRRPDGGDAVQHPGDEP